MNTTIFVKFLKRMILYYNIEDDYTIPNNLVECFDYEKNLLLKYLRYLDSHKDIIILPLRCLLVFEELFPELIIVAENISNDYAKEMKNKLKSIGKTDVFIVRLCRENKGSDFDYAGQYRKIKTS